jgi:lantibiotic modifying enzyme
MRKLLLALLVCAFSAEVAEARKQRAVRTPPAEDHRYAEVATHAAAWVAALGQPSGDRTAWPTDATASSAAVGLAGTTGVGMLHLRLYQVTRDPQHLETANRASNYIARFSFSPNGWEWQSGAVGCASFLMALYRETGDVEQLRRAQRIADWVLSQGIADADGGLHWVAPSQAPRVFTGIAHGAAGVAMLLLQIHEKAPEPRYLAAAEAALRWTARYTIPIGTDGIGWKRLTTDSHAYHGWCGGSAGMIFVLAKAYELTGNAAYRAMLVKTAEGLIASGRREAAGMSWTRSTDQTVPQLVYCHGSGSIIGALSVAYEATGDARYLEVANEAVAYLMTVSERHGEGLNWPHGVSEPVSWSGFSVGTASIGHAFLRLYGQTGDPRLLDLARRTAAFLMARAEAPRPGQLRWASIVEPVPAAYAAEQAYKTGWWDGTAGIAMFFLELHDYTNGRRPPRDFSPANP